MHSDAEQKNLRDRLPPDIDVVRAISSNSLNQYILLTESPNDRCQNGYKQKYRLVGNSFQGSLDDEIELVRQSSHLIECLS